MKAFIASKISEGRLDTPSEYIRFLVRAALVRNFRLLQSVLLPLARSPN